ncbi:hypothetical protein VNO77_31278 [Canavalia gladiata]|uniref:Uncharacterized protein n=1 Tax=Canavalia gladiata TaxID=3824 RepID=A0AAN9KPJ3_CANGL
MGLEFQAHETAKHYQIHLRSLSNSKSTIGQAIRDLNLASCNLGLSRVAFCVTVKPKGFYGKLLETWSGIQGHLVQASRLANHKPGQGVFTSVLQLMTLTKRNLDQPSKGIFSPIWVLGGLEKTVYVYIRPFYESYFATWQNGADYTHNLTLGFTEITCSLAYSWKLNTAQTRHYLYSEISHAIDPEPRTKTKARIIAS